MCVCGLCVGQIHMQGLGFKLKEKASNSASFGMMVEVRRIGGKYSSEFNLPQKRWVGDLFEIRFRHFAPLKINIYTNGLLENIFEFKSSSYTTVTILTHQYARPP